MIGTALDTYPVHLGLGATAAVEPAFTGVMQWYADYLERHQEDGREGRLVIMQTFSEPWATWEMHPEGAEIVVCTAGTITIHQELPNGNANSVQLTAGQYAINDPMVWHTADVSEPATVLFITAGFGTQQRPR